MKIGQKFDFISHGKKRTALFIEDLGEKVKAILISDWRVEGLKVEINKKQIKL